jgi:hypothetical protein
LDAGGVATYVTNSLSFGVYPVTADYGGTVNFNPSSGTLSGGQVVTDTPITDLRVINSSPNVVGNPTVLTATASGDNIVYTWNLGDGSAISSGSVVTHTYGRSGAYTAVVTASNGGGVVTATTSVVINPMRLFMPLVMRNYASAPDLVVERIIATRNSVQVVIKNQGNMPVMNEFWVDVYLNPNVVPTHVNQTWNMLGSHGLTWGVTSSALPALTPGGMLTLTLTDGYYQPDYSNVSWPLPVGMPVYAQVDSADAAITWGAALENHEIVGGPYNILGPVYAPSAGTTSDTLRAPEATQDSDNLSPRP